jgi:hypothetical protein
MAYPLFEGSLRIEFNEGVSDSFQAGFAGAGLRLSAQGKRRI